MAIALDVISWICLAFGGFLCVSGGVGILRFPDFYARMHGASITDTLAAGLILLGLMLQTSDWIVIVKLLLVGLFLFFTSPTASHALAKAAVHSGLKPLLDHDLTDQDPSEAQATATSSKEGEES